jgi:hypothetical protein
MGVDANTARCCPSLGIGVLVVEGTAAIKARLGYRLRGVDLKRLAFGRVLETQTFGRLGRARVFEVVDHVGHFHESLTCFERLRRFTIHFQGNGAFQHIDKPRCRMSVSSGFCARCNVCNPKIHLAALDIGKIHFEKVGSLDRLLLGIDEPTTISD